MDLTNPCGPVPGADDECACGCSAYEEICDYHLNHPESDPHRPTMRKPS